MGVVCSFAFIFIVAFSSVTPQMSSSTEDSVYEPSLRSLNTSDNSASSSDNDYFWTSEEDDKLSEEILFL